MSNLDLKSLDGLSVQANPEEMTLFRSIHVFKRRVLIPTLDLIIRSTFILLTITALWYYQRSTASISAASTSKCNPFAQPGALFLNIENVTSTQWKPFDSSCPSSHLLPLVQAVLDSDAMYGACQMQSVYLEADLLLRDTRHALPWLADKTM